MEKKPTETTPLAGAAEEDEYKKKMIALANESRVLVVRRADKETFAQFDAEFVQSRANIDARVRLEPIIAGRSRRFAGVDP